jgi:hypothetical protein
MGHRRYQGTEHNKEGAGKGLGGSTLRRMEEDEKGEVVPAFKTVTLFWHDFLAIAFSRLE